MSYECCAIFAKTDTDLLAEAQERWSRCLVRKVEQPFVGIAVATPTSDQCRPYKCSPEEEAHSARIVESLETDVLAWSREHPTITFVVLTAKCFGGSCDYEGYACKDGEVILRDERGSGLAKLVKYLGTELDRKGRFAPFERGFFHSCRPGQI